jgi:ribosomal protein S18 acetylase RimI-like enzyme
MADRLLSSYEIQVGPAMRRRGIGKHLMDILDVLGKHTFMKKVMLTVQTGGWHYQRHLRYSY